MIAPSKPFTITHPSVSQMEDIDRMFDELYRALTELDGTAITTGTLAASRGGTGIGTYVIGDLLYASATDTLSRLADVAVGKYLRSGGVGVAPLWSTVTLPNSAVVGDLLHASSTDVYTNLADIATGNALISGGVGVVPSYGKIGLTTHVSGVLPIANGGTNSSTALSGSTIVISDGTSIIQGGAGTTVTVLHGNAAGAPTYGAVVLTTDVSGILPVANGGTATSTQFTAGSVIFAGTSGVYSQDNANFFWDNSSNLLGIGTTTPLNKLHIVSAGASTSNIVELHDYSATVGFTNGFLFKQSNSSTLGTLTATVDGQYLGACAAFGVDSGPTAFRKAIEFDFLQDGTAGATYVPGAFVFITTNTSGANAERMRLSSVGNLLIGTTTNPTTGTAGLVFGDGTALATMASNTAGLYADDVSGTVKMFGIDEAGNTGQVPLMTGTPVQGDILYGATAILSRLAKNASATRYLSNTGTSNDPAWAQVALATGVSGDLPFANFVQSSAASRLVGRGSASGAGDFEEITLGTGLTMSGTSLTADTGLVGRSTAQTAAITSLAAVTVGAADASYEVSGNILITTATTHSFNMTCAYTDEGNTARTVTLNFSTVAGAISNAAITNAAGAVPYEGVPIRLRCKASTTITLATSGTFTTVTYNAEGMIRRIS